MSNLVRIFFAALAIAVFAALVYIIWSVVSITPQETNAPTSTLPGTPATGYDSGPREAWKTWTGNDFDQATNATISYSLEYPRDFDARQGDQAGGGNFMGEPQVSLNFPADAFDAQKTNFAGGAVVISVAKGTSADVCYADPQDSSKTLMDSEAINGIPFKVGVAGGAGAGNFYDSRVYRTVYSGNCYELVSFVHTTNVDNYEPGTVTEFNAAPAWSVLDQILRSVTFSTSSQQ